MIEYSYTDKDLLDAYELDTKLTAVNNSTPSVVYHQGFWTYIDDALLCIKLPEEFWYEIPLSIQAESEKLVMYSATDGEKVYSIIFEKDNYLNEEMINETSGD